MRLKYYYKSVDEEKEYYIIYYFRVVKNKKKNPGKRIERPYVLYYIRTTHAPQHYILLSLLIGTG